MPVTHPLRPGNVAVERKAISAWESDALYLPLGPHGPFRAVP